jgi:HPt (histidine-containing phosphotransfer) domain-containing protein
MSSLDPSVLAEHRKLGDDVVVKLIQLVKESLRRNVATIQSAGPANPEAVSDAAHSIKNSSNNVGATHLRELAAALEKGAGEPDAAKLIDDICAESAVVVAELDLHP